MNSAARKSSSGTPLKFHLPKIDHHPALRIKVAALRSRMNASHVSSTHLPAINSNAT
ncbi:hypothetical protein B0G75_101852 [Paraburkholderia sp. BL18I3N2]|uniref:hypothetical protein n=1 Tax=Paraburkholderia sp. BL18I3N2 TaxID=1938799 RepID=UPI000D4FEBFF|nr:hypothetical protein [Paraburkholderia sp. BL18I3N2]PRX36663.1 hypothetical protein B0G75_101852 [Paraburkholderia sp. BL18I3N2]